MAKHTTEMKMVQTSKLIPYVNNARTHSQEQVNKLRGSLREFGFINPVIIDADYNDTEGLWLQRKKALRKFRVCSLII